MKERETVINRERENDCPLYREQERLTDIKEGGGVRETLYDIHRVGERDTVCYTESE